MALGAHKKCSCLCPTLHTDLRQLSVQRHLVSFKPAVSMRNGRFLTSSTGPSPSCEWVGKIRLWGHTRNAWPCNTARADVSGISLTQLKNSVAACSADRTEPAELGPTE